METTDLSTFKNDWYASGAPFIKQLLWYFLNVIVLKNPFFTPMSPKIFLLRLFGAEIGNKLIIKPSVNIKYPWRLKIGNNCWIGENVWIDNLADVSIGDNVCISQGAMLLCGNHNYKKTAFDLITGEITLENGVWIGAKATVCPGILCESHSVLGVSSVASTKLEAYSIYRGNPATIIHQRIIH